MFNEIIVGNLENGPIPNLITLMSKKVAYNYFKKNIIPNIVHVQKKTI